MEKNREEGRYWVKTKRNPNDWAVALFTPFHKSPDHFSWVMNGGYFNESDFLVVDTTRIINPDEVSIDSKDQEIERLKKIISHVERILGLPMHRKSDFGKKVREAIDGNLTDKPFKPYDGAHVGFPDEVTPTNTGEKAEPLEIWLRCQTCNGEGGRYTSKFGHLPCDSCGGSGTIRKEVPAPLVNKEETEEKEETTACDCDPLCRYPFAEGKAPKYCKQRGSVNGLWNGKPIGKK